MRDEVLRLGPIVRRGILRALIIGVPILFLRFVQDPFNVPKLSLLMSGVALVLGIRLIEITQGAGAGPLMRLAAPALLLAVPLVLAWLASPYRWWALFGNYGRFQGLVPYLVVILFGLLLADAFRGRAREIAWASAVAAAIVGGYCVVQILRLDPFEWGIPGATTDAAIGTLGNSNFAGGFLAMMLPSFVVLYLDEKENRTMLLRLGIVAALGWIATFSQGALLAGIAALAVVGGVALSRRWSWAAIAGGVTAAAAALSLVGFVVLAMRLPESELVPATVQIRSGWWISAAKMGAEHPLLGRGPNTFAAEGVEYRTVRDAVDQNVQPADDPHSVPLSLFAGAGIPGILGFFGILGWTVYQLRKSNPQYAGLVMGFAAGVIGYFVQSLVSIDELSLRLGLWINLAGLAVAINGDADNGVKGKARAATTAKRKPVRRTRPKRAPLRRPIVVFPIAAAALLAALMPWGLVLADARAYQGRVLLRAGDLAGAERRFSSALALRDEYQYRRLYGLGVGAVLKASERPNPEGLEEMKKALSYLDDFPDVPVLIQYARTLAALAETPHAHATSTLVTNEAVSLYRRAISLDPLDPLPRMEAAQLLANQNKYEEAITLVQSSAPEVKEIYPRLWGLLALLQAEAGNREEALEALAVALHHDPTDPNALAAQQELESSND